MQAAGPAYVPGGDVRENANNNESNPPEQERPNKRKNIADRADRQHRRLDRADRAEVSRRGYMEAKYGRQAKSAPESGVNATQVQKRTGFVIQKEYMR